MVAVFTNSKKQSLRLKWLCIEVARLCCDLSDALPEMICLCFVNAVPKVSLFVRLDTLPGREARWVTLPLSQNVLTFWIIYATIILFVRHCVTVAQQTLTLFVWVRILVPQPNYGLIFALHTCFCFYVQFLFDYTP